MDNLSLIRTKLHRPRSPENHVFRVRLTDQLHGFASRSSILISAGAGYGKSTLVSSWLEVCGRRNAWLSLDVNDNDLQTFLLYFVAAIQNVCPGALKSSADMVKGQRLPSIREIVHQFTNEIDTISEDFVLVLDDIHTINNSDIHDFLDGLLRHPPRPLLLVLIGRRDPPLSIPVLRARNQLGEIRVQHLRFTEAETFDYLHQVLDRQIAFETASMWMEKMEGWITGLHLVAFYLLHGAALNTLPKFQKGTHHIMEYLLNEVLFHQPAAVRDRLMETSILNRFCVSLCDAVCNIEEGLNGQHEQGSEFIRLLQNEDLFIISLDEEGYWFRYHHLFQQLLASQLKEHFQAEQIAVLHVRASRWYESKGLIDEAVEHALESGEIKQVTEIIDRYRHGKHISGEWYIVEKWLSWLPKQTRQNHVNMLLAQAWVDFVSFRLERIPTIVEQIEQLLGNTTATRQQQVELNFFKGNNCYWGGEPESCVEYLEAAREMVTNNDTHLKSNFDFILGMAHHMLGRKKMAIGRLTELIKAADPLDHYYRSYLFGGLAFLHLLSGELAQTEQQGRQVEIIANKCNAQNSAAWGYHLQGAAHLQNYNLTEAIQNFSDATKQRYVLDPQGVIDAMVGQALAHHFNRQPDKAEATTTEMLEFARDTEDPYLLSLAQSGSARLAVLRGDLTSAAQWIRGMDESTLFPAAIFIWVEVPCLTHARVLIAIGSKESLEQAHNLLQIIWQSCDRCHFIGQKIETGILQSLTAHKQGRTDDAITILEKILLLMEPSEWIRPFVEAGLVMHELLGLMQSKNSNAAQLLALLTEIESTIPITPQQVVSPDQPGHHEAPVTSSQGLASHHVIDLLTNRELDILELLGQRLQNKEIAEKLCVSPHTVGFHLKNIYQKLGVNNRLKAVKIAKDLKIC